jgi:hypothetical protein
MLRGLAFTLLGLSLLAGPAAARGDGPAGGRRAEAKASGGKAERTFLLRRVAAIAPRPAAAPSGPAACARAARGVLRCRGGAVQAVSWRWAQGLPPALGVQAQECPAGTMATLAEGHEDIVRCIPI